MKQIARTLAILLALLPAVAAGQTFPTVPSQTVIGRTAVGTGPSQAIPFSQLLSSMLTSPLSVSQVNVNSILFAGATSGTATLSAHAVAGTPALKLPNTSGTLASNATTPIVLNSTTGNISCPTCVTTQNVLQSRAAAAAADLSSLSAIRTLGYATAGDGGGAVFKKVGTTPFLDSFVTAISITGNGTSGCTNGTYRAKQPTGGTGSGLTLTLTVSGNVVSAATITGTGGNGYTAGDVLSTTVTGCSTTVTVTVSTISTPTGSFTDSAGNHWQIVEDLNSVNIRQFGAKQDWTGTDGSATNDFTAIQNALKFAGRLTAPSLDAGGTSGATVLIPRGSSLICGGTSALLVPGSVQLIGAGAFNSVLKLCDSGMDGSTHVLTLCDPNTQLACFGAKIANFTMYSTPTPASSANIAMVYSNNVQQVDAVYRVAIYPGLRSCGRFETGYGGAAYIGLRNLFCTPASTSSNPGININYGTTIISLDGSIVESGGSGATLNGVQVSGGFVTITDYHTEGISTGIFVNIPTSNTNGIVTVRNATGGSNCSSLITKQSGSAANSLIMTSIVPNGCTNTYTASGSGSGAVVVAGQTIP